jgi:hypothetical protein
MNHQDAKSKVRDGADAVADGAESIANLAVDAAMGHATSVARSGRSAASDYMHSLGDAVNAAARMMESDGYQGSALQAARAAAVLDELSNSIANYDVKGLVNETANALRARPALTFSLVALAGYAMVRLAEARSLPPEQEWRS